MKHKTLKRGHPLRPRRVKTFKGCWTCRDRKVSCDLQRPDCKRCIKSGLTCAGYDIKLIWTPISQFNAYGAQITSGMRATKSNDRTLSGPAVPVKKNHQRRKIDFVRYGSDYINLEDVEREIALLDNPPHEKIEASRTWMLKRFGVFQAKIKNTKTTVTYGTKDDSVVLTGVDNGSETGNVSISSQGDMYPQNVSVSDDPQQRDNSVVSDWPHDLEIMGNKAQGLELFAAELRDDVELSTLALHAQSHDGKQEGAFEGVSFDDSFLHFLKPAQEEASTTIFGAEKSKHFAAESRIGTEKSQALSSTTHGESQPGYSVDSGGIDVNPFDPVTMNSTGNTYPEATSETSHVRSAMEVISLHLKDEAILKSLNAFNPWFRIPETGYYIHGLTRLLLNHYMDTVADKMIVVAVPKNPWRTIYFSRVMNALGDLTGLGHTSYSRNSLLNAILALSCFHLLNKFPKASTQQTFFLNLGIDFRRQASHFLKLCLQKTVDKEKYKDILIAIISLSSVDVVWGTMTDCKYYLEVCEGFIKERVRKRPAVSKKAKALHSIFSFLKLIQDSTSLDKLNEDEVPSIFINDSQQQSAGLLKRPGIHGMNVEPSKFCFQASIDLQDGRIFTRLVEGSITSNKSPETVIPLFTRVASEIYYLSEMERPEANMLGPDALYGLPNSLIFLFANCVKIVKYIQYFKLNCSCISDEFQHLLSDFEEQLLRWKPEWKFHLDKSADIFINDTFEGVYHHSMSFYYGLLIYFFTMARSSELASLQGYAEKALVHLKVLSRLREEKGVKVLPLMWQGFIAGCASISEENQREFRLWAANFAENGMGSYWGARQVMFEVWKRMKQGHPNDNWYSVYKDWCINLMLF